jgi:RNase P subunit RPR2
MPAPRPSRTILKDCTGCGRRLGRDAMAEQKAAYEEVRFCTITCAYCGQQMRYAPQWRLK